MIKPLHDFLVVRPDQETTETSSGILLPQTRRVTQYTGVVLEVGPGRLLPDMTRSKMHMKPGDRVVYHSTSGTEVEIHGEKALILSDKAVLAIQPKEVGE